MSLTEPGGSVVWDWQAGPVEHSVRVRVMQPAVARRGWLVWAHGGSWRGGSVDGWHAACAELAECGGCTVVSVDYRLAPKHRHPAAVVDVLTALEWAAEKAEGDGSSVLGVGGDSAGGTIAACAALLWRDRRPPLAAQVLAYPPLDPLCRAKSYAQTPSVFPDRAYLLSAWADYRSDGPGTAPPITPFDVDDLSVAAPAVLAVGERDPVADDVRLYAIALRVAGVPVDFIEFPQTYHGAFLAADDRLRRWLGERIRHRFAAGRKESRQ